MADKNTHDVSFACAHLNYDCREEVVASWFRTGPSEQGLPSWIVR